jgi:hypothetical protein
MYEFKLINLNDFYKYFLIEKICFLIILLNFLLFFTNNNIFSSFIVNFNTFFSKNNEFSIKFYTF